MHYPSIVNQETFSQAKTEGANTLQFERDAEFDLYSAHAAGFEFVIQRSTFVGSSHQWTLEVFSKDPARQCNSFGFLVSLYAKCTRYLEEARQAAQDWLQAQPQSPL